MPQESSDFGRKRSIRAAQRDRPLGSINTRNGNGSLWSMPKGHIYYIYRFFFPPSMSSSSSIFISLSLSCIFESVDDSNRPENNDTGNGQGREDRRKKSVNNNKSIVCGTWWKKASETSDRADRQVHWTVLDCSWCINDPVRNMQINRVAMLALLSALYCRMAMCTDEETRPRRLQTRKPTASQTAVSPCCRSFFFFWLFWQRWESISWPSRFGSCSSLQLVSLWLVFLFSTVRALISSLHLSTSSTVWFREMVIRESAGAVSRVANIEAMLWMCQAVAQLQKRLIKRSPPLPKWTIKRRWKRREGRGEKKNSFKNDSEPQSKRKWERASVQNAKRRL